jgi:hypothetical protein
MLTVITIPILIEVIPETFFEIIIQLLFETKNVNTDIDKTDATNY